MNGSNSLIRGEKRGARGDSAICLTSFSSDGYSKRGLWRALVSPVLLTRRGESGKSPGEHQISRGESFIAASYTMPVPTKGSAGLLPSKRSSFWTLRNFMSDPNIVRKDMELASSTCSEL